MVMCAIVVLVILLCNLFIVFMCIFIILSFLLPSCCLLYTFIRSFRVSIIVLKATFNNISVMSWRSGLLEEETRVPDENQVTHNLSHNVVSSTIRAYETGFSRYIGSGPGEQSRSM